LAFVRERFDCAQADVELDRGRRNEQGVARPAAADPVLRLTELAWVFGSASVALEGISDPIDVRFWAKLQLT
jgi:hypothetical protein